MTDKEKRIEEMSRHVCASCDYDYNGSCGLHRLPEQCHKATNIAEVIYEAGYRKQVEGEWIETVEHKTSLLKLIIRKKKIYCCPYCGRVYRKRMNYCGHCGVKMKGGESDDRN